MSDMAISRQVSAPVNFVRARISAGVVPSLDPVFSRVETNLIEFPRNWLKKEGFMHIPHLLVVVLLISVSIAPVAAQSSTENRLTSQPLPMVTQSAQAEVRADQNPPAPIGKLVDVGGYRVHLYCTGTGSPTVVIVGAAFSFDWGLVQPEVARSTQVCSYDHSGIGWSDSGPKDSCSLRVSEIHNALKNAGIKGPYVLVGHSLGGLVARLYAGRYPDEVAGIVFVDHAFMSLTLKQGSPPTDVKVTPPPPSESKNHSSGVRIESDLTFNKLSSRDRQLHLWAMSQTRNQMALRASMEMMPQCIAEADAIAKEHSHPLSDKPLVDVSTDMGNQVPNYAKLQTELLSLSRNSKQVIADKSGHFIIIDRPDVVIDAISQAVQSVRNNAKL
jgi:pimeloyl-ACP methyl ester carboxylesterase